MDNPFDKPAVVARRPSLVGAAAAALAILAMLLLAEARGDELTYQPVNPAFGGNPLNGSFLLSTAEAKRPKRPENKKSPLDRFTENIQATLLNRISQEIADAILGEGGRDQGSFTIGGTQIDFRREGGQVLITVRDENGSQVNLEVPIPELLAGASARGRAPAIY